MTKGQGGNPTGKGHKAHGSEDEERWKRSQRAADIAKSLEKQVTDDKENK